MRLLWALQYQLCVNMQEFLRVIAKGHKANQIVNQELDIDLKLILVLKIWKKNISTSIQVEYFRLD